MVPFPNENPEPVRVTSDPLPAKVGFRVIEGTACTNGKLVVEDVNMKIADMRSTMVTASRDRRLFNSKHATLWRLAISDNI